MRRFCEALEDRRLLSTAQFRRHPSASAAGGHARRLNHLVATPITVHAEATDRFSGQLAKLPANTAAHVAELGGAVDWGDGSATSITTFKASPNSTIYVNGAHTYAKTGSYNIKVTVFRRPYVPRGQANPFFIILLGSFSTTAKITPDDDGGVSLTETASTPFTAKVGSFDFGTVDIILGIRQNRLWGDGHTSAARSRAAAAGSRPEIRRLRRPHTYAARWELRSPYHRRDASRRPDIHQRNRRRFFSSIKVNLASPARAA